MSSTTSPPEPMSVYVVPSFVNCHLSVVSLKRKLTFVLVPRSILLSAFLQGVPVSSLFSTIILSPMFTVFEFTEVVVPFTVRLPVIVTLPPNAFVILASALVSIAEL